MNIRQLIEELQLILNEMAINRGNKPGGKANTINEVISLIVNGTYTEVITNKNLKVNKIIDNIQTIMEYPIVVVLGEQDIHTNKGGHGYAHFGKKHLKDFSIGRGLIDKAIKKIAYFEQSKKGWDEAIIVYKNYKFVFAIDQEQAVLNTFYKLH